jgi:hypothetical protein
MISMVTSAILLDDSCGCIRSSPTGTLDVPTMENTIEKCSCVHITGSIGVHNTSRIGRNTRCLPPDANNRTVWTECERQVRYPLAQFRIGFFDVVGADERTSFTVVTKEQINISEYLNQNVATRRYDKGIR